jgi:toxin ParE1/3/4
MSLPVRRTFQADADLDAVWLHIATDSVAAADRLIKRIEDAEERLGVFPELGQARPDVRPGLRYFPVSPYLIFYRIDPDAVTIVRVIHGHRDLWTALGS